MKITWIEGITYGMLYIAALGTYGRILRRFYFFHMPFTSVLDWGITFALLIFFIRIIYRHRSYTVRLIYFLGVIILPYLVRLLLR